MQLNPVTRRTQKLRLALQGGAGTGKTYTALVLAFGLTGSWQKIALIDTEASSASLYSHLGTFHTLQLGAPFTPERYIDAIRLCEEAGIEVIVIDSISPEWMGENGIMDIYSATPGDSYAKWNAAMPRHHVFLDAIVNSTAHMICTVRTTRSRLLQDDGYAHHFTTLLTMDESFEAIVIKDRTSQLWSICPDRLSVDTGCRLRNWCDAGITEVPPELEQRIKGCNSVRELYELMYAVNTDSEAVMQLFSDRKHRLETMAPAPHEERKLEDDDRPLTAA